MVLHGSMLVLSQVVTMVSKSLFQRCPKSVQQVSFDCVRQLSVIIACLNLREAGCTCTIPSPSIQTKELLFKIIPVSPLPTYLQ